MSAITFSLSTPAPCNHDLFTCRRESRLGPCNTHDKLDAITQQFSKNAYNWILLFTHTVMTVAASSEKLTCSSQRTATVHVTNEFDYLSDLTSLVWQGMYFFLFYSSLFFMSIHCLYCIYKLNLCFYFINQTECCNILGCLKWQRQMLHKSYFLLNSRERSFSYAY